MYFQVQAQVQVQGDRVLQTRGDQGQALHLEACAGL